MQNKAIKQALEELQLHAGWKVVVQYCFDRIEEIKDEIVNSTDMKLSELKYSENDILRKQIGFYKEFISSTDRIDARIGEVYNTFENDEVTVKSDDEIRKEIEQSPYSMQMYK